MSDAKKGPGRPRKYPAEARRQVTFRIRDEVYHKLRAAMKENGRSLSEEIEWSIEIRFERASIFDEIARRVAAIP